MNPIASIIRNRRTARLTRHYQNLARLNATTWSQEAKATITAAKKAAR